jgi:hypothetical protein
VRNASAAVENFVRHPPKNFCNSIGRKRPFDDPIALPRGRQLITLQDVADYIMKLPKADQAAAEWQTAIEC